jgi:hypothetical protein
MSRTDYLSTVYVVNWSVAPEGVGGFEWRADRADAVAFMREIADPTARLHVVAVPDAIATDAWAISEWLDSEGWSDGIDPRGLRPIY